MIRRRKDIDLEVLHDADRGAWVVRQFGGDPKKVFAVEPTKAEAYHVATALAKVFARYVNRDGSCEVYVRNLDGTLPVRNTAGHDPRPPRGSRG